MPMHCPENHLQLKDSRNAVLSLGDRIAYTTQNHIYFGIILGFHIHKSSTYVQYYTINDRHTEPNKQRLDTYPKDRQGRTSYVSFSQSNILIINGLEPQFKDTTVDERLYIAKHGTNKL